MIGFFGLFSQMMIKLQNKSVGTIEMYPVYYSLWSDFRVNFESF